MLSAASSAAMARNTGRGPGTHGMILMGGREGERAGASPRKQAYYPISADTWA